MSTTCELGTCVKTSMPGERLGSGECVEGLWGGIFLWLGERIEGQARLIEEVEQSDQVIEGLDVPG